LSSRPPPSPFQNERGALPPLCGPHADKSGTEDSGLVFAGRTPLLFLTVAMPFFPFLPLVCVELKSGKRTGIPDHPIFFPSEKSKERLPFFFRQTDQPSRCRFPSLFLHHGQPVSPPFSSEMPVPQSDVHGFYESQPSSLTPVAYERHFLFLKDLIDSRPPFSRRGEPDSLFLLLRCCFFSFIPRYGENSFDRSFSIPSSDS